MGQGQPPPSTGPRRPTVALVLSGGGARTAYQVGVLQALAAMLKLQPQLPRTFPFKILVGTSAGAINAAYLAGHATQGLQAFELLANFWGTLRSRDLYRLQVSPWVGMSRLFAAWSLARQMRKTGAILDSMPLVDTLHRCISLPGIEAALQDDTLHALAITASSYTSGAHWTFCHTGQDTPFRAWSRPGRRSEFQPITIEHLLASSALPFMFPATPLWVDGHREFFGDGAMRQTSPLSPAIHLNARKLLVVGAGQTASPTLPGQSQQAHRPSLGGVAGHVLDSVFYDTMQAHVDQAQRLSENLKRRPRDEVPPLNFRNVEVLAIQPSQSLDDLAQRHSGQFPRLTRRALGGLGLLNGSGAMASYLLFEPAYIQALMGLGQRDAYAQKEALLNFFSAS